MDQIYKSEIHVAGNNDGCGLTILPHPSLRHTNIQYYCIIELGLQSPHHTSTYATPTLTPPLLHSARFIIICGPYL